MNNKKKIGIVIAVMVLLATICGIVYYIIYKNVTDRESFNDKIENISNTPVDTIIESNKDIKWNEITKDGVNEEELLNNIDIKVLENVATLLQELDKNITENEEESPEYVLRGNWLKEVVDSKQYKKVISMGSSAMKPLYLIIYKSSSQGRYEYICALALEELSGFNFDEDGDGVKWVTSKEFLNEFNKKIIDK